MKITFGKFVLKSIKYIVLMNIIIYILCAVFQADFYPDPVTNLTVPIICASASLWGESWRQKKLARKNK